MDQGQSSASDATSSQLSERRHGATPRCHCSRPGEVFKAWTKKNPGRRFYRCEVHGFISWVDTEEPSGWMKISLLEARDQIRRLEDEIKILLESNSDINSQLARMVDSTNSVAELTESLTIKAEENKALQLELTKTVERERLLRQFMVISWVGFAALTAVIVTMVKK
ncbi:hypothetical protein Bca101_073268 [Brassica carinata]